MLVKRGPLIFLLLHVLLSRPVPVAPWTFGVVDSFHTSTGYFRDPPPQTSVWGRVQMFFHEPVVAAPVTTDASLDYTLYTMDWFTFVDNSTNSDLTGLASPCLIIAIEATTAATDNMPAFEARMHCACYLV